MDFKNGSILTDRGKALQAKVEAGATLKLTRMVLGSGTVESMDEYAKANALILPQYSMIISGIKQENGVCEFTANISSDAVENGFSATEAGIYAMDGEEEILYTVSYDKSPTYIPGKNEGVSVEVGITASITFSCDATITIAIPKTQDELITLVQNSAISAMQASKDAKSSKSDAEKAASRAETSAKNAAVSAANAKSDAQKADSCIDWVKARAAEIQEMVGTVNKKASETETYARRASNAADSAQRSADASGMNLTNSNKAVASINLSMIILENKLDIVHKELEEAQKLNTGTSNIQYFIDDTGYICYRTTFGEGE